MDLWYNERVYYQTGETFELKERNEVEHRPTPVLKGLRAVSEITFPSSRKRKNADVDEIVYEANEGEFDDRLDGAYWCLPPPKRSRKMHQ